MKLKRKFQYTSPQTWTLTALICVIIIIGGCSKVKNPLSSSLLDNIGENQDLSKKLVSQYTLSKGKENRLLSAFAKQLALSLNNSEIRSVLLEKIANSRLSENIVSLENLLEVNVSSGKLSDAILSINSKSDLKTIISSYSKSHDLITIIKSHPLGIDVYFPVKEHRELILRQPNHKFLVTYCDGYADDQVERKFPAWDSKGNKFILSSKKPPSTPVLVITQCEHHGKCRENSFTKLRKPAPDPPPPPPDPLPEVRLYFNWYCVHNDHEPWYSGEPEIYTKTWLLIDYTTKVNAYRRNQYFMREKSEWVSNKFMASYAGYDAFSINRAKIEVWEDDPGSDDWLERYGGWYYEAGNGSWHYYNDYIQGGDAHTWYGDDHDCDLRIFLKYFN